jgi:hypothetical protein
VRQPTAIEARGGQHSHTNAYAERLPKTTVPMTIFPTSAFRLTQNRPNQRAVFMNSAATPAQISATREALCRRIDDELTQLGDLKISSWMTALTPARPASGSDDGRAKASEVELDAALGGLFWRARAHLERTHCFHVIGPDGALVAVYTPKTGALSVRGRVAVDELAGLELHRRPIAAGTAPPDYRPTRIGAVLWRFALFGTDGDQALPAHYRQLPLKLNRLPSLDPQLVAGRHLKLMQLLHEGERTFHGLLEATGLSDSQLARDLAALLLVGCLVIA